MKKILIISALFLLMLLLRPGSIFAQGSCQCSGPPVGGAECTYIQSDSCGAGYTPECVSGSCGVSPNCTCILEEDKDCGGEGESCCPYGDQCSPGLTCWANLCGRTSPAGDKDEIPILCSDGKSIDTAIGCIPIQNTNEFIEFILRWAIGIGGGIAFLLIVFAGFQIMTSAGNPERLKAGQELLTSAIAGLILLIFSVFILRIIGVNILGIFKP